MFIKILSRVFNDVFFPLLLDDTPIQIYYGGGGSGKSVFLAQRCVLDVVMRGRNYLIVRNVARTLRQSVFNEVKRQIRFFRLGSYFDIREGDMVITCRINQAQIFFRGLDDVEKLKSVVPMVGVISDVWMEEATESSEIAYKQLRFRLRGMCPHVKRTHLSFNPIVRQHWIYSSLFGGRVPPLGEVVRPKDNTLILRTHYKHNKFLTAQDVATIEEFKGTDPYIWSVYGMGEWGTLGKTIFHNWSVEDLSGREFDRYRNGLDFGYANDPAALIRSARKNKRLYVSKEMYATGLTNDVLAEAISPIVQRELVWCDSAEPKSIAELKLHKIRAAPCSKKRATGISASCFRIQWLQQHEIVVDERCQNFINELSLFSWSKDKYGDYINIPIDKFNHGIDALGYSWESEMDHRKPLLVIG